MTLDSASTAFVVYHWVNPQTTSDYPYLAVAAGRAAVLSFGNYELTLDWGVPAEVDEWLEQDFSATGESLRWDFSMVEYLLDTTFAGGAEFLSITYNKDLVPSAMRLALASQEEADQGPEYVIHSLGSYQRLYREPERLGPVSAAERAMLDVCVATFGELAVQCATKLTAPPPPRYRAPSLPETRHLN
jgi:hypothetical protein